MESNSGQNHWDPLDGTIGRGVTADSSNNIFVTGTTSGGLDGNTNSGGTDIFLAKFDSAGTFYSSAEDSSTESVVTLHNLDDDYPDTPQIVVSGVLSNSGALSVQNSEFTLSSGATMSGGSLDVTGSTVVLSDNLTKTGRNR